MTQTEMNRINDNIVHMCITLPCWIVGEKVMALTINKVFCVQESVFFYESHWTWDIFSVTASEINGLVVNCTVY